MGTGGYRLSSWCPSYFMPKPKPPRKLVVELPKETPRLTRHKQAAPRIVLEISEGGASLLRCPFKDIDIEIHDYDVPEDWGGPDHSTVVENGIETSIKNDVFGRRYQCIKFTRRSKIKHGNTRTKS